MQKVILMKRLLVLVPDRISQFIDKGEVQPGYYNPGNVCQDVHILMTNDDQPPMDKMQYLVGDAKLTLHNYPDDLTLPDKKFSFLTPRRLQQWAKNVIPLAKSIAPDMMRCHASDWNTYLASEIKKYLGIPYCVSLHINPDENPTRRFKNPQNATQQRHNAFYEYLEREGLCAADKVLPVYQPILSYLRRMGVKEDRIQVTYNVLNTRNLKEKTDYTLNSQPRAIYVGRLIDEKYPDQILRAMVNIPELQYTIVGDGPRRADLENLVEELSLSDRVEFKPAIPNDELCAMLPRYDMFLVHTEYWEINKSVLEALLSGLPIIMNKRIGEPVQELQSEGLVYFVENTAEDYQQAIQHLLEDHQARESLGRSAYQKSHAIWDPEITTAAYVKIYESLLGGNVNG